MACYDAIVIGLGIHGSSSLFQLSKKSRNVLGIEQYSGGSHVHGSSHGQSRIIRKAYYEDPSYVPLLSRAFDLWKELELVSHMKLLQMTGCLLIGKPESEVIRGSIASVTLNNLDHELLSADEIKRRFHVFNPVDDEVGVYENDGGHVVRSNSSAHVVRSTLSTASAIARTGRSSTSLVWSRITSAAYT